MIVHRNKSIYYTREVLHFFSSPPLLHPPLFINRVRSKYMVPQGELVSVHSHVYAVMKLVRIRPCRAEQKDENVSMYQ